MADTRHVDVTFTAEAHARLVREAKRRGLTLAGYVRQRALGDGAGDAADLRAQLATLHAAVRQLSTDLRAAVRALAAAMVDVRRLPALADVLDEMDSGRTERDEVAEAAVRAYEEARGAVPRVAEEDEG